MTARSLIWRLQRANAGVLLRKKWAFLVMLPIALWNLYIVVHPTFSHPHQVSFRKGNLRRKYAAAVVLNMLRLWGVSAAMVQEREARIRDVLRALGLKDQIYYFAWTLTALLEPMLFYTVFWLFYVVGMSRVEELDISLLYVYLLSLAINVACAGFHLLMGVICSGKHWVSMLCFVSVMFSAFYMGNVDSVYLFDSKPEGDAWATLIPLPETLPAFFFSDEPVEAWLFMVAALRRIVYGAVCLVLAMYLDQVLPRKFGVMPPRSPLFFLQWVKARHHRDAEDQDYVASAAAAHVIEVEMARATPAMLRTASAAERNDPSVPILRDEEMTQSPSLGSQGSYDGQVFEPLGPQREALLQRCEGVHVCKLRKVFNGDVVAVADLSFAMVPGEVFCLLGRNGAGKTTAISMIAGILQPTGGNAVVFKDPVWGPSGLASRGNCGQSFGICTQENMLIPCLRLKDHLILACHIRGVGEELVDPMLDRFGLTPHKDMCSTHLSSGTARRMNVAMAFASTHSRAIILDEPTVGVDPQSRRAILRTIADLKQDRVVLVSTHYLEEAEILADQVAIMSKGHLCCSGSTNFLKRHYGCGYILNFDLEGPTTVQAILHRVVAIIGMEPEKLQAEPTLVLRVPFSIGPRFPDLFESLHAERGKLGILAFGVSITSIEDVFLGISGRDPAVAEVDATVFRMPSNGGPLHLKRGQPSWRQQFSALLRLRLAWTWKSPAESIARIILPVLLSVCNQVETGDAVLQDYDGQFSGDDILLVMMLLGLYKQTSNGTKQNQMSSGCGIWAWHLAFALIEGMITGLSLLAMELARTSIYQHEISVRHPDSGEPRHPPDLRDPRVLASSVPLAWVAGSTWALHASLLHGLRSIITRRRDGQSSVIPIFDAFVYVTVLTPLKPGHLLLDGAPCLPVDVFLEGRSDPRAICFMLVHFVVIWWLAGRIDWMLLRPEGRKCLEKLRKGCGYVCFLGVPYWLSHSGDGQRDPQAHLEDDVIMDESSKREAERVQTDGREYKRLWVSEVSKTHKVFRFGCWTSRTKVTALRNVSLQMDEGILGLLGVNGAGKSTLLKIIVGEEHATTGSVKIEKDVGYCCQETALYPKLTAVDHLRLYGRLRGLPEGSLDDEVHQILRMFAIRESDSNKAVGNLSGGVQRRIMVCLAVIGSPRTLVLDEPSCGVDAATKRFMWEKLERLSLEKMVLYVSHSMEEAEALCSRVAILDKGVVRCIGKPSDLAEEYGAGSWEVVITLAPKLEVVQRKMSSIGAERDDLPIEMLLARMRFQFEDDDGASSRLLSSASSFPHMREVIHACCEDAAPQSNATTARILMAAVTQIRKVSGISALDLAWALATESAGLRLQATCPFDCALEDSNAQSWRFRIRLEEPHSGQIFAWLEEQKANMQNFEYNIFQTTLESVFQSIVRQSEESI